jgi:hypothetical protein
MDFDIQESLRLQNLGRCGGLRQMGRTVRGRVIMLRASESWGLLITQFGAADSRGLGVGDQTVTSELGLNRTCAASCREKLG